MLQYLDNFQSVADSARPTLADGRRTTRGAFAQMTPAQRRQALDRAVSAGASPPSSESA